MTLLSRKLTCLGVYQYLEHYPGPATRRGFGCDQGSPHVERTKFGKAAGSYTTATTYRDADTRAAAASILDAKLSLTHFAYT